MYNFTLSLPLDDNTYAVVLCITSYLIYIISAMYMCRSSRDEGSPYDAKYFIKKIAMSLIGTNYKYSFNELFNGQALSFH